MRTSRLHASRTALALAALALALVTACSPTPQEERSNDADRTSSTSADGPADSWLADVDAIATAGDNSGRREAIRTRLDALGLDWRIVRFAAGDDTGENILAQVSGSADAPLLLLGAHSDRVDVGQGATDNASGSATTLALAERFRQRPLANHRVAIAFWDLEERGLLGAHVYVADGGERPALYVNFDVFGWGDTVWMMTPDDDHPLVAATRRAADEAGLRLSAGADYPPTDHRAFLDAGWPAVSYALVDRDEIELILDMYAGNTPSETPKVMQVIHEERDTMDEIDAAATARGIDAIETALRRWDAGQR